jgi:hypothetical protein
MDGKSGTALDDPEDFVAIRLAVLAALGLEGSARPTALLVSEFVSRAGSGEATPGVLTAVLSDAMARDADAVERMGTRDEAGSSDASPRMCEMAPDVPCGCVPKTAGHWCAGSIERAGRSKATPGVCICGPADHCSVCREEKLRRSKATPPNTVPQRDASAIASDAARCIRRMATDFGADFPCSLLDELEAIGVGRPDASPDWRAVAHAFREAYSLEERDEYKPALEAAQDAFNAAARRERATK